MAADILGHRRHGARPSGATLTAQSTLPRTAAPDSTPALLVEGYEFVSNRCRSLDTDVFETRLNLRPTICMRGHAAAELFYASPDLVREGAAPRRMRRTLFGEGGVQGLDGDAHRHRKRMFLSFLIPDRIGDLAAAFQAAWRRRLPTWRDAHQVVLFDEVGLLLTDAVHNWAGVPLAENHVEHRRDQLRALIEGGGGLGPNYVRGRLARRQAETELAAIVERVREGTLRPPPGTALHTIAAHRDTDGDLLPPRVAAVEVLNVLRPTVAVDRFVTFIALALHDHPEWLERLADAHDDLVHAFVQEVRRYYPFFPFAAARVARDFTWQDHRFTKGHRVLLDLYATNHDPRVWSSPATFDPDRFVERDVDAYELVAQGGGDHLGGHRCAGEWATIELMQRATRLLVEEMTYDLPPQDLSLQRGKVPALPTSGLVITEVRPRNDA